MSRTPTEVTAALAEATSRGLSRLEALEAKVFRFGMAVRAFLAAFPEDLPAPDQITPHYSESKDGSFLHMVVPGREAVEAWAGRLGVAVEVLDHSPGMTYLEAEGTVDGLRVSVTGVEYTATARGGDL